MTDIELQFVSTERLSQELANRFDGLIIHGIQKDPKNNQISIYFDHYKGDQPTEIGLCDLLKRKIIQDWDDKEIK